MSLRNLNFSLLIVAALTSGAATVEKDGIQVEFVPPVAAVEGEDVDLRFALRAADGTPLAGVRPAAWIDIRDGSTPCTDKVKAFLGGTLRARPQVDLNTYYVITLNAEPSIAVIDPLLGFGGSKLLTAVNLQAPGVDWALSRDQKRLFIAMPLVNRVAVIDTETWKVIANVEVGLKPSRLALQEKLWVVSEGGVSVIDTATLVSVEVPPPRRHTAAEAAAAPPSIAFDDRHAYVAAADNILVIDRTTLKQLATIPFHAASLAHSSLSKSIYAIDGSSIAVISDHKLTNRIEASPGLTSITFAPGGRWGFITDEKDSAVHILDSSTNKIVSTAANVGARPDQIAFTSEFAYVRAAGSEQVKMIRLASLATDSEPALATFPGGQIPPAAARAESFAAAIVPAPEPKAVLVANPSDRTVYYYMEGMAAPMGNFTAQKRTPKAVLVLDRSLKETEPSVFSIKTRIPTAGNYDVAFFLNSPRVVHCFDLAVAPNPNLPRKVERAVKIEPLLEKKPIRAGEELEVRFRLTDANTDEPHRDVRDLRALAFLAPGTWQQRIVASGNGDGTYCVKVPVPESGIYYVFVESASLNLKINKSRPLIFEAIQ